MPLAEDDTEVRRGPGEDHLVGLVSDCKMDR